MEHARVIGLDIGTTTICALVLDGATGNVLETVTQKNNSKLKGQHTWERLQDVKMLLAQTEKIVSCLKKKYAPIACIGITGQMHGIVYIDKEGDAVSPLATWQDERGNLIYKDGLSYTDYLSQMTGYKSATGFGAVTHFYNTVNGLVPAAAVKFCTIMDYVAMKLSKASQPMIHLSNAASIGLFSSQNQVFDQKAIEAAGMEAAFFPEVIKSAQQLEGKSSVPVAVAIGDNQASFMGSVKNNAESLLLNIGTSSQISAFTHQHFSDLKVELRPFTEDGFLLVGSPLCGGRAYALLESFFREIVKMAVGQEPLPLYQQMGEEAGRYSASGDALKIVTQFCGTRENPSLRGEIHNLGVNNFTPQHFIAGVLQGMADELYALYELMKPELGAAPKMLIGSGNGLRMNQPLQKILIKLFNLPLFIPIYKEEASYGAALFALVSGGVFKSIEEAQQLIQYE